MSEAPIQIQTQEIPITPDAQYSDEVRFFQALDNFLGVNGYTFIGNGVFSSIREILSDQYGAAILHKEAPTTFQIQKEGIVIVLSLFYKNGTFVVVIPESAPKRFNGDIETSLKRQNIQVDVRRKQNAY